MENIKQILLIALIRRVESLYSSSAYYALVIRMGEIRDKIVLSGSKKSDSISALFDSASTYGSIDDQLTNELGLYRTGKKMKYRIADGSIMEGEIVMGMVKIKGCEFPTLLASRANNGEKLVIGHLTMQTMGIQLDPQNETYTVRCNIPRL